MSVRVRFAPSPTGYLHIGGARTILFNWLFARKHGGVFVLRIEDTDADRVVEDSVQKILDGLEWLGLEWDEGPKKGGPYGPYWQSQRRHLYAEHVERLVESGLAYRCYCTPQELEERRKEALRKGVPPRYDGRCRELDPAEAARLEETGRRPAIRLRTPGTGVTAVRDLIHGEVTFSNSEIGDFVLVKSDGMPTYNFACVVDDSLMRITHVIRGDEHVSNTPRQVLIYQALGYDIPKFAHVPMILAPDRSKLSKRHGATSVEEFRRAGFLPEALVNYLALLGWSPDPEEVPAASDSEFMDKARLVELFSLERVSPTPAVYDVAKLTWMNAHYIRTTSLDSLAKLAREFFREAPYEVDWGLVEDDEYLKKVLDLMRGRTRTLVELVEATRYYFSEDWDYDAEGRRKHFSGEEVAGLLSEAADALERLESFDPATVEGACREIIARHGIPGGALIHPTRLAVTGATVGPSLFQLLSVLGKEAVVRRIRKAVDYIRRR